MSDWQPGDPLYPIPPVEEPLPEGPRRGGGRPMTWTASKAVPGPWSWLQPGIPPVRLEVAA